METKNLHCGGNDAVYQLRAHLASLVLTDTQREDLGNLFDFPSLGELGGINACAKGSSSGSDTGVKLKFSSNGWKGERKAGSSSSEPSHGEKLPKDLESSTMDEEIDEDYEREWL
jgi:hypothetical protein